MGVQTWRGRWTAVLLFLSSHVAAAFPLPSMSSVHSDPQVAFLPTGEVMVISADSANTTEIFDPLTARWRLGPSALVHHRNAHATTLPDGSVVLMDYDEPGCERLLNGTWQDCGPLHGRDIAFLKLLQDGRLLAAGGRDSAADVNQVDLFDFTTGSWTSLPPMSQARSAHTVTQLGDGRVLVLGGGTTSELLSSTLSGWTAGPSLAGAPEGHTSTLLPDGRVLLLSASAGGVYQFFQPTTGQWSPAAAPSVGHQGHLVHLLPNGTVLVLGASTSPFTELFDPAANSWSQGPPLRFARMATRSVLLPDGRVMILGGQNAATSVYGREVEALELFTPKLTATASSSSQRQRAGVALLPSGRVLRLGGLGAPTDSDIYDPTAQTWEPGPSALESRIHPELTELSDGRVLVTGGGSAEVEVYDEATLRMTRAAPLPSARSGHRASRLQDGLILLTGGDTSSTGAEAWRYHPGRNTWQSLPSLPSPRSDHTQTVLRDGTVLITGGRSANNLVRSDALRFDPQQGQWTSLPSMSSPRAEHSASLLPDGRVLVAGGTDGTNTLNSAQIFDPQTGSFSNVGGGLAQARRGHQALSLVDGRTLFIGGEGPVDVVALEVFDLLRQGFASVGTLGAARPGVSALRLKDNSVLLAGGEGTLTSLRWEDGREAQASWAPRLNELSEVATGARVTVTGERLRGISSAVGDNYRAAHSDIPYVTLSGPGFEGAPLPPQRFTAASVDLQLPPVLGRYTLHVTVNGISSAASPLQVGRSEGASCLVDSECLSLRCGVRAQCESAALALPEPEPSPGSSAHALRVGCACQSGGESILPLLLLSLLAAWRARSHAPRSGRH